ncbi:MAG: VWA domain-containing protein [Cyclobacteriaceae bacterium]|nr:MAG: VWA domain-containing protein [Cyclobacteriaceae bacterium]
MRSIIIVAIIGLLGGNPPPSTSIQITGSAFDQKSKTPLIGVVISVKGTKVNSKTDFQGRYRITVNSTQSVLVAKAVGFVTKEIMVGQKSRIDFFMTRNLHEVVDQEEAPQPLQESMDRFAQGRHKSKMVTYDAVMSNQALPGYHEPGIKHNTESYSTIRENIFHDPTRNPLSTFSIDVDAASYSNVRRFLRQGQMPPKDAVRIEEMINYFTYDYPEPAGEDPFSVTTELATAPWNPEHKLMHIGLQGKNIPTEDLPASNLVFLIDVSGSMNSPNKLGLLKAAFKMLTQQLRSSDKVSMVVYAGAAGMVLPPTPGNNQQTIKDALNELQAGGSTAGGEGIKLAYKLAREQFIEGGNNRVILATDGDFNIGASSDAEMERLIEKERSHGVFLTVLGFGMGNYKDSKMEILADKGNGNYAYIDDIMEARKVLVNEFGGTLFTIAKDVKIQIEFNPQYVKGYRLIGYVNRKLNDEDFNDDQKDAGELGSGHSVTALYEIITHESESSSGLIKDIDDLKYQRIDRKRPGDGEGYNFSDEIATVKLRYKQPQGGSSRLITRTVGNESNNPDNLTENFRWSAAVASFGMLLRDSEFKGNATYANIELWARGAIGVDRQGYRAEFIKLVQTVDLMAQR